jgi:hypothetical protein
MELVNPDLGPWSGDYEQCFLVLFFSPRFEYHMFYVLCPFVTYLLTPPRFFDSVSHFQGIYQLPPYNNFSCAQVTRHQHILSFLRFCFDSNLLTSVYEILYFSL